MVMIEYLNKCPEYHKQYWCYTTEERQLLWQGKLIC